MSNRYVSFLLGLVMLLIVCIILIWHAHDRIEQAEETHKSISRAIVNGTVDQVSMLVRDFQEDVHVFAEEYTEVIAYLSKNPQSNQHERFEKSIDRRFPGHFAYTIADPRGKPLIETIDSLVGDACRSELTRFSDNALHYGKDHYNTVFIHPQPGNYHFDVMAPWKDGKKRGVFFVSFRPDIISKMLGHLQLPGHQLVLVNRADSDLIEISAEGSRDQLSRDPQLSTEELRHVTLSSQIPGTAWRVLDIMDPAHIEAQKNQIYKETFMVLGVVMMISLFLLFLTWRLELRCERKVREAQATV